MLKVFLFPWKAPGASIQPGNMLPDGINRGFVRKVLSLCFFILVGKLLVKL
jgi:hypothetical protein